MKVRADIAPPRQLEYAGLTHGGRFLVVTVLRARGGKQRPHTETYAVERDGEAVRLVKADGRTAYTVTRWNCDCRDDDIRGRERTCKHRAALAAVGVLGETIAAQCEGRYDDGRGGRNPDTLPEADQGNPHGARADAG
jgi:xanthine/CO dehydrogenase XdhC/CoxF family maturation factor